MQAFGLQSPGIEKVVFVGVRQKRIEALAEA